VEAAQRFLEAKERYPVGSEDGAYPTAWAFDILRRDECSEVTKPEWWNDEGLKALSVRLYYPLLSARVVRAAPNEEGTNTMRAAVLSGMRCCGASLGSGAQGGGYTLRSGCGAVRCSGGQSSAR